VCLYSRERDTVTNLDFDEKGEMDEEKLLQAESEYEVTAEQKDGALVSAKIRSKIRFFEGH
jgi:hypothetical protein